MDYFVKNGTLFVSNASTEEKESLHVTLKNSADTITPVGTKTGALDKTLYQFDTGFVFENEGSYSFAVVGEEVKDGGGVHIVLSNDQEYFKRLTSGH